MGRYTKIFMKKRKGKTRKTSSSMKWSKVEPTKPVEVVVEQKPQYTHEQLLKALYFAYDLFERAQIPFMLLGDTAKAAKDGYLLSGDGIYIGVKETDWHESNIRVIEACYMADIVERGKVTYLHEGVPIYCSIIKDYNGYSYDQRMYQREFFNFPNPFELINTLQTIWSKL